MVENVQKRQQVELPPDDEKQRIRQLNDLRKIKQPSDESTGKRITLVRIVDHPTGQSAIVHEKMETDQSHQRD